MRFFFFCFAQVSLRNGDVERRWRRLRIGARAFISNPFQGRYRVRQTKTEPNIKKKEPRENHIWQRRQRLPWATAKHFHLERHNMARLAIPGFLFRIFFLCRFQLATLEKPLRKRKHFGQKFQSFVMEQHQRRAPPIFLPLFLLLLWVGTIHGKKVK